MSHLKQCLSERFSYKSSTAIQVSRSNKIVKLKQNKRRTSYTSSTHDDQLNTKEPEQELKPLPDLLSHNLKLLFIGYNPSIQSSIQQHRFAHPTNTFWKLMHESGITDKRLKPKEDEGLRVSHGIGFTELVRRPTKGVTDLSNQEMMKGVKDLLRNVKEFKPKVVCLVGRGVFDFILKDRKIKLNAKFQWGQQKDIQVNSLVDGVKWFVVPSTSGLVRISYDENLKMWNHLHQLVESDEA